MAEQAQTIELIIRLDNGTFCSSKGERGRLHEGHGRSSGEPDYMEMGFLFGIPFHPLGMKTLCTGCESMPLPAIQVAPRKAVGALSAGMLPSLAFCTPKALPSGRHSTSSTGHSRKAGQVLITYLYLTSSPSAQVLLCLSCCPLKRHQS